MGTSRKTGRIEPTAGILPCLTDANCFSAPPEPGLHTSCSPGPNRQYNRDRASSCALAPGIVPRRDRNVASGFLRMAGGFAVEHRSPRIAICLFHHRIDLRMDDGGIFRLGGDVRPAPPGVDPAEGADIRSP